MMRGRVCAWRFSQRRVNHEAALETFVSCGMGHRISDCRGVDIYLEYGIGELVAAALRGGANRKIDRGASGVGTISFAALGIARRARQFDVARARRSRHAAAGSCGSSESDGEDCFFLQPEICAGRSDYG